MKWNGRQLEDLDGVDLAAAKAEAHLQFYAAWGEPGQAGRLDLLFRACLATSAERRRRDIALEEDARAG